MERKHDSKKISTKVLGVLVFKAYRAKKIP